MKSLLLKNAKAVLPHEKAENVSLKIENGKFVEINSATANFGYDEEINLENSTAYAGFIDIHNHGAVGVDVNTATVEDLRKVSRFLVTNGIAAWLPTLVPDSDENCCRAIEAIDKAMRAQETKESETAAQILGFKHLRFGFVASSGALQSAS